MSQQAAAAAAVDKPVRQWIGVQHMPEQVAGKVKYLFNNLSEAQLAQVAVDEVAVYSVTAAHFATKIAQHMAGLLQQHLGQPGRALQTVIDGTACVGGDSLALGRVAKHVVAYEIAASRAKLCHHNVHITGLAPVVEVRNEDVGIALSQRELRGIDTPVDAILFDPPWGGPKYAEQAKLNLWLGPRPLAEIAHHAARHARVVVLKVPTNFDAEQFAADTQPVLAPVGGAVQLGKKILLYAYASKLVPAPEASAQVGTKRARKPDA